MAKKRKHPAWAQRERPSDTAWVQENLHVLWPAAEQSFKEKGRGAVIVDTTVVGIHATGVGNPMYYLAEAEIDRLNNADALRMVREYDPSWELVIGLLRPKERESFYRIGIPALRPKA